MTMREAVLRRYRLEHDRPAADLGQQLEVLRILLSDPSSTSVSSWKPSPRSPRTFAISMQVSSCMISVFIGEPS